MKRLLIVVAIALAGCTNQSGAIEALNKAGFTNIEVGGYDLFACGEDDAFSTRFTATNPQGQRVSGTVCSGWFKGSTIRF